MCLAIPGRVIDMVDPERHIANVEVAGVRRNVKVGLLTGDERPELGEYVLIHVMCVPGSERGAAEILGIDLLYVANEGKLVAVVAGPDAQAVLEAMRAHPLGGEAAIVGSVLAKPPGMVSGGWRSAARAQSTC